ncbi:MAG: M56 family metallopeptidase [Pyrinomonadaceae bacterium]
MTNLEMILAEPVIHALGWALLHFVWQGALIALFTVFILRLLRDYSAGLRYAAASTALLLMLIAPIFTAWRAAATMDAVTEPMRAVNEELFASDNRTALTEPRAAASDASQQTARPFLPRAEAAAGFPLAVHLNRLNARNVAVPWLAVAWLMCVLLLLARVGGGLLIANRLRRAKQLRPVAPEWCAALDRLARHLDISRRVGVYQSTLVQVPTTIGWLRPVVLVPESAFASLSAPQLEAILAHELTHIRRHDYLINILQSLAEALLFYHPAVWWVAKQIRVEREHVCDDRAIAVTGSVATYARALTEIELLCQRVAAGGGGGWRSPLALGAGGAPLLARIGRLIKPARNKGGNSLPGCSPRLWPSPPSARCWPARAA